jgi:hypothetical protein
MKQVDANAKATPDPVDAPARHTNESAIIQRLAGQRDALRRENQALITRFETLDKKVEMLVNSMGNGFGNEEQKAKLAELNKQRDDVVNQLTDEQKNDELVQVCVEASNKVIDRLEELMSKTGVNLNDLSDPDVKAMQELHDAIYFSGKTDYSELIYLASQIREKRLLAKQPDPAKLKEDGAKEAREGLKKLGAVNVDVPGASTAQSSIADSHQRRLAAMAKAFPQSS